MLLSAVQVLPDEIKLSRFHAAYRDPVGAAARAHSWEPVDPDGPQH